MTNLEDSNYSKLPDGSALLNSNNRSDLYLKAILYLLEDPALDRNAFEEALAEDNGQLAELVSSAAFDLEMITMAKARLLDQNENAIQPVGLASTAKSDVWSNPAWYTTVVASCFVVALIGWQFNFSKSHSDSTTTTNTIPSPAFVTDFSLDSFDALDVSERTSLVKAWTEFRGADELIVTTLSDALVDGPDCVLCSHRDATVERDLPDWLVHGASALVVDAIESDVN
jgi:hypothetical protein